MSQVPGFTSAYAPVEAPSLLLSDAAASDPRIRPGNHPARSGPDPLPLLYLAIPAQNEVATIGVLLWRLRTVLAEFPREYEVVVYDDASTDETAVVAEQYVHAMPVTVLRGKTPVGYAGAVDALARYVANQTRYPRRDAMLLLQGDFTDPPGIVPEFARRFEGGADLVIGERTAVVDAPVPVRRLFSAAGWALRPFVRVNGIRDLTGSMRLVRISALRDLVRAAGDAPICSGDSWTANADLLLRLVPHARKVETVPMEPTYGVRTRETRRVTVRDGLAALRWAWRARGRKAIPSSAPESSADGPSRGGKAAPVSRRRDDGELTADTLRERSRERERLRGDAAPARSSSEARADARSERGRRDANARNATAHDVSARTEHGRAESRAEGRPEAREDARSERHADKRSEKRTEKRTDKRGEPRGEPRAEAREKRDKRDKRGEKRERTRETTPLIENLDELALADPFAGKSGGRAMPPSASDADRTIAPTVPTSEAAPSSRADQRVDQRVDQRADVDRNREVQRVVADVESSRDELANVTPGNDDADSDASVDATDASASDTDASSSETSAEGLRERKRRRNRRSRRRRTKQRGETSDAEGSTSIDGASEGASEGNETAEFAEGRANNKRSRDRQDDEDSGGPFADDSADDAAESTGDDSADGGGDDDGSDGNAGESADRGARGRGRRRGRRGRRGGSRRGRGGRGRDAGDGASDQSDGGPVSGGENGGGPPVSDQPPS